MSTYQQRLQKFIEEATLYPVSCEKLAMGRSDRQWLEAVLAAGVKIVQLRDKEADGRTLLGKARMFRELTRAAGALLIVNDRLDVALLSEADGVHLGNDDLPCEEVRRYAPELLIGVSCNREEEAASAEARGASYYNIGPLFPTGTKEEPREVLGIDAIARFSRHSPLPFTVMGGIKKHHLPDLLAAGVKRPAVVTALTQAADISAEAKEWLSYL
ncbi:thiamine phosphate synthase [Desulfurivibrio alkaliphilus]|uniref:Thiamine-phosphate synthase n=1 Tax=Desulfurivibrio alkaliphilus (strain DSM 19089 / UNIQEM U267 / AHT2) TaxID=589865 RepID=D6Z474_DESAT|nr:thiamine phosphate synthase [Desulfurivibrio alkaliphilus]ADH86349.1 thiamine-phosphate pyrophosphorylase [Desulfurivibrio alkaliphilus AHT 2]